MLHPCLQFVVTRCGDCLSIMHDSLQVLELFKAADKYDVAGLVKECVQIFKKITHAADVAPLLQVSQGFLQLLLQRHLVRYESPTA